MITYAYVLRLDDSRVLILKTLKKTYYIRLQRSMYHKYKPLLTQGKRILVILKKESRHLKISRILKVYDHNGKVLIPLFHQNTVLHETRDMLNQMSYSLFLDLEMSMHPYYYAPSFKSEIIQVGYVLTNQHDDVIKTYHTYIKPESFPKLTPRTLKFLDITQDNVDHGISFKAFYKRFEALIKTYQPGIFVWGQNDEVMFKESIERYRLTSKLNLRFIDLLKMHKIVYMYKNDLGLQKAYEMYGYHADLPQKHDAFDDALMTEKIYQGFKAYLNQKKTVFASYYLYE